jgi:hypothetical protein
MQKKYCVSKCTRGMQRSKVFRPDIRHKGSDVLQFLSIIYNFAITIITKHSTMLYCSLRACFANKCIQQLHGTNIVQPVGPSMK